MRGFPERLQAEVASLPRCHKARVLAGRSRKCVHAWCHAVSGVSASRTSHRCDGYVALDISRGWAQPLLLPSRASHVCYFAKRTGKCKVWTYCTAVPAP